MQIDLELIHRMEEVEWRKHQLYWALQIVKVRMFKACKRIILNQRQ